VLNLMKSLLGTVWNHSRSAVAIFYGRDYQSKTLSRIFWQPKRAKTRTWCNILWNLSPKISGLCVVVKIGGNWSRIIFSWSIGFSTKFYCRKMAQCVGKLRIPRLVCKFAFINPVARLLSVTGNLFRICQISVTIAQQTACIIYWLWFLPVF